MRRFANDFHSWLRHSWKLLANRLTRDPKIVIHGYSCIVLYFLNENIWISIKISPKFVLQGPINNIPAMVPIIAWRHTGDMPLSEPMMVSLSTHICVTQPQWVNVMYEIRPASISHYGEFNGQVLHQASTVIYGFPIWKPLHEMSPGSQQKYTSIKCYIFSKIQYYICCWNCCLRSTHCWYV